jgi:sterol desaturase/sphingolipid hydroxylase (fatty acid hydroxylase superfamily)
VDSLYTLVAPLQSMLFEHLVEPALYDTGLITWAESAYEGLGDALLGLLFIAILYTILRPLEALAPIERWSSRRGVRVDVLYTLLEKTGFLQMFFFLVFLPIGSSIEIWLHGHGYLPRNLEDLFPWLRLHPLAAVLAYLLVIDFFEYWRHRLQHHWTWWWGLHCIHHSQQTMSLWSDSRNHVLDSLLKWMWLAALANVIGVAGTQFLFLVLLKQGVESLSHANVRLSFGAIGDRLIVSPRFHRVHHTMGIGHIGRYGGCNFAPVFSLWDVLFRTARFDLAPGPTGVVDQRDGVDYGAGFWAQQRVGLARLFGRTGSRNA